MQLGSQWPSGLDEASFIIFTLGVEVSRKIVSIKKICLIVHL